ncbi:type I-B CRISPR-associated protein Cas7/Csh2 [Methanococcus maripaludis]|jgi:CRISPR-associated protein Csh2|uniref:Type I-B CRISPR-associated protein Cas7/Csh2 n=3 Tax=Methanococcus maripaludis TaxID=39152 RepID=A0A8T3VV76_METMI|nr:type I-B CRISPR-associated protein Cas7/Csh2 [Methanococcus maripaludis]AEK19972.1 CRISPR-associated Csh2 family protein [Methanococcus maripaludis X1]MBG0768538.1 type I-B CRISPR-associated protein Cas7/Csh2 [Methanococcus maripaludis]BAP63125.1 CRISPR-associated protein Csh2 [Methanococcus maripaludis OS7]
MVNSREFLMVWDSTMANPNGDMLNDNKPRQDESTGQLEVSDVRIKRFIRDEWISNGKNVLVQTKTDKNGKVMTCQGIVKERASENNLKDEEIPNYLLENYIDVRLFGAVITKPKYDITGPLQIAWSKSVHEADVKFMQGNAAYASGEGKEQASIWSKFISPYALFKTYAVYNDKVAEKQGITVSDDDLNDFKDALINGLKNYRSTSKNQMPRLLVEVIYNNNKLDGELNYIDITYENQDLELRDISQVVIDLSKLCEYALEKSESIEKIIIYKHKNVNLINVPENAEENLI